MLKHWTQCKSLRLKFRDTAMAASHGTHHLLPALRGSNKTLLGAIRLMLFF